MIKKIIPGKRSSMINTWIQLHPTKEIQTDTVYKDEDSGIGKTQNWTNQVQQANMEVST